MWRLPTGTGINSSSVVWVIYLSMNNNLALSMYKVNETVTSYAVPLALYVANWKRKKKKKNKVMYNIVALFFQLILMCVRPRTSLSFSLSRMLSHTRTCTKTQTHALNNNNENCCVPNLALKVISVYTQSSQTSLQRYATKTNHYTAVTNKSTTTFWHSHKWNALKHCIS